MATVIRLQNGAARTAANGAKKSAHKKSAHGKKSGAKKNGTAAATSPKKKNGVTELQAKAFAKKNGLTLAKKKPNGATAKQSNGIFGARRNGVLGDLGGAARTVGYGTAGAIGTGLIGRGTITAINRIAPRVMLSVNQGIVQGTVEGASAVFVVRPLTEKVFGKEAANIAMTGGLIKAGLSMVEGILPQVSPQLARAIDSRPVLINSSDRAIDVNTAKALASKAAGEAASAAVEETINGIYDTQYESNDYDNEGVSEVEIVDESELRGFDEDDDLEGVEMLNESEFR